LLGKQDLKSAIIDLFEENPKVFEIIDILIAVRKKDKKKLLNESGAIIVLESYFDNP